ncbi:SH3 domain-containing protein [Cytophagaceae bacterium YF14B1]|uniref:SH3 domain-containing protein n=1 Tax=Xanthocytophaga flava TaxID=3048013 RepID=A0AAE3UB76_9BACT|nr:SH3 domain-containing protein [Xanthocytophaga flavus]MDJ1483484.1 SH3 domain-containing protein [Xanthocytophaga flavus]
MRFYFTLLCFFLISIGAYCQEYRYVNADKLNVRSEPSSKGKILLALHFADQVELISEVNSDWAEVEVQGVRGYVSSLYLVYDKQALESISTLDEMAVDTAMVDPLFSDVIPSPKPYKPAQPKTTTRQSSVSSDVVYICDSQNAYAYHRSLSCRGLGRCKAGVYKATRKEASSYRSACKICY